MSMPGMGVMIGQLFGGDRGKPLRENIGKVIMSVELKDDALRFVMADGARFALADEGQSCCEHRYMATDDNLADYAGARLLGVEIKEAPNLEAEYDTHEVEFLEVQTDKGVFTMASHNEHNGYYGGFHICARAE